MRIFQDLFRTLIDEPYSLFLIRDNDEGIRLFGQQCIEHLSRNYRRFERLCHEVEHKRNEVQEIPFVLHNFGDFCLCSKIQPGNICNGLVQ